MASTIALNIARHLGLAVLASILTAATASAGPVTRSNGNGTYINVSGTDSGGCIWFYLYASRGGTTQAPDTYVFYDVYNRCTSEWIAYGGGRVVNTALKTTKKSANLTLDAGSSLDFSTEGAIGSLDVTLTADGFYSSSYSGHSRTEYAGHLYQSHGSWTWESATATGSILGFTFGTASGSLGEGRDKFMDIDRGPK
jgi:hypothetical protein